jgi:hypothetical protein
MTYTQVPTGPRAKCEVCGTPLMPVSGRLDYHEWKAVADPVAAASRLRTECWFEWPEPFDEDSIREHTPERCRAFVAAPRARD